MTLSPALVLENLGRDRGAGQRGRADLEGLAFAGGENVVDLDGRARLRVRIAVDHEDIPLGDGELLALGLDGGFHK